MSDRILVVGLGRFGIALARKLVEMGHDVVGVDTDEPIVNRYQHEFQTMVADMTDEEAVRELIGAGSFDLAVVAIGTNERNSALAAMALRDAGVPRIIAKATNDLHGRLLRPHVDRVIFPERDYGEQIALEIGRKGVLKSMIMGHGLAIEVVASHPTWSGLTVQKVGFRSRYGVNVLIVERNGTFIAPVQADTLIQEGDKLWLLGRSVDLIDLPGQK